MVALACFALLVAQAPVHRPAPPAAIALSVATAVGATVRALLIEPDGLTDDESAALRQALARTGLFAEGEAGAAATLAVRRIDPQAVLVTVTAADGQRLFVGEQSWPATTGTRLDDEVRHERRLRYARERLRLVPVAQDVSPAVPFLLGDLGPRYPHEPLPWRFGLVGVPTRTAANDWLIMRGPAEVLSEDDLAVLLGDGDLQRRLADERFWPRVAWVAGFGGLAAAGIGSGAYLSGRSDRDTRTVGLSLITAGVVSAALALLFPVVGPHHVLDAGEAARLVDDHNERLRRDLELGPADLQVVGE